MIFDLSGQSSDASVDADVVVVGAGIAGLLLACKLKERGARVVVLESGGHEQEGETHPLNQVVQLGHDYRGAMHGRFRCLGGSSTRWGGAMLPFLEEDMEARPHVGLPAWPVGRDAVLPYLAEVETLFDVDRGPYDEDAVRELGAERQVPTGDPDFVARFPKWPVFNHKNIAVLLGHSIGGDDGISVWLNATVTEFETDGETGRLASITARDRSGKRVTVRARHAALCAGAIESTRLLLLLDAQHQGRIFSGCEALGRTFFDHLALPVARIEPKSVYGLNRLGGFRFADGGMRGMRFELSPEAQRAERSGSAFGHVFFTTQSETGFNAASRLRRALQNGSRIPPSLVWAVVRDLPYFAGLAFWRLVYKQLYWPRPANYELFVVAEQAPRPENRITLGAESDEFGLPRAAIDWRPGEGDFATIRAFCRRFESYWRRQGLSRLGELQWIDLDGLESAAEQARCVDVFHPGGSTRMGHDPREAVVDADLRTFAVRNLWVASTSVFPSAGSSNPTLMLMLFTLRLADRLAAELARPSQSESCARETLPKLGREHSRARRSSSVPMTRTDAH